MDDIVRNYLWKNVKKKDLSTSEKEELIRLKAGTEYLKTENTTVKKLIALRRKNSNH